MLNRSITEKKQDTDNDVPDSAEPGGATPQTSVIQYDFQVLEDFSRDDKVLIFQESMDWQPPKYKCPSFKFTTTSFNYVTTYMSASWLVMLV